MPNLHVRGVVAFLLVMLALSFSNPLHLYPLPNYIEELFSACGVVLAAAALLWRAESLRFSMCSLLWLALGGIFVLSALFHSATFSAGKVAYLLYWAIGGLALLVGEQIDWSDNKVIDIFSRIVFWCALVGVVVGGMRHLDLLGGLSALIPRILSERMIGLIGHANLFAYLCLTGFFCASWRWHSGVMRTAWFLIAGMLLISGLLLSGTRSALVAWVALVLLLWLRDPLRSRYKIALTVGLLVVLLILPAVDSVSAWLVQFGGRGVEDDRLFSIGSRGFESSGRIVEWKVALAILADHLWFGVGVGNYAAASYAEHLRQGIVSTPGLFIHSHNLVLQLAAETGVIGVIWCGFAALLFCVCGWRVLKLECRQLPVSILFVFGVYSFFEFPLWLMHFLVLNLLLIGSLSVSWKVLDFRFGKIFSSVLIGVLVFGLLVYVPLIERFYWSFRQYLVRAPVDANQYNFMNAMIRDPLMEPAGYMIYFANFQLSPKTLKQEREVLERFRGFLPYAPMMARLAFVQVAMGDVEQGRKTAEEARVFYGAFADRHLELVNTEAVRVFPDVNFSVLFPRQG